MILRASQLHLSLTYIPLVLVIMNVVYTLSAYPVGKLSDRMPRRHLLALGMLLLALACGVLAIATNYWLLFLGVALWGLHMGFTQGILASLVADTCNTTYRGTAFGVFNVVSGLGLLLDSVIAGVFWEWISPSATFIYGATISVLALILIMRLSKHTMLEAPTSHTSLK